MKKAVIFAVTAAFAALAASPASAPAGESLLMKAPTDVAAGQQFTVEIVPMNPMGETARGYKRKITLSVEGQRATIDVPLKQMTTDPASKRPIDRFMKGTTQIALGAPGWYRLVATDGALTAYFPVRCHKKLPKDRIYWGEIHTHSNYCKDAAGGAFSPAKSYTWGREVACLDFGTVVAHHWSLDQAKWQSLTKITNGRNEPGKFVAILGYEWGQGFAVGQRWNHNNVYFLGDAGPLAPNMKSVKELWPWLDRNCRVPVICIPHHPAMKNIRTEWESYNPKYQPVVEVYSQHGNSERAGAEFQGVCTWADGYVQKGLEKGVALGFIAGGDNHAGRMGTNSKAGKRRGSERTGIAAVFATELTRKGLWQGLKSRYTYGTSGACRIILEFSINGRRMGEAFRAGSKPRKIAVEVGGTANISKIEIVKNNAVVHTATGKSWHEKIALTDTRPQKAVDVYYVRVTQADGNMAWSSPIWVGR